MNGTERRRAALKRVEGYVCAERQQAYGDAEDNFATIANYWNEHLATRLTVPLSALDVAAMMVLTKIARLKSSPLKLDNWDDMAGYAVCGAGIVSRDSVEGDVCDRTGKTLIQHRCSVCDKQLNLLTTYPLSKITGLPLCMLCYDKTHAS